MKDKKDNTGEGNSGKFLRGNIPWNKGLGGYKINYPKVRKLKISLSTEHKSAISEAVPKGDKHRSWRGGEVKRPALHEWITKQLGRPQSCQFCGCTNAKRFEWANKTGQYLRDLNDWLRLCTSCHRKYDLKKEAEGL